MTRFVEVSYRARTVYLNLTVTNMPSVCHDQNRPRSAILSLLIWLGWVATQTFHTLHWLCDDVIKKKPFPRHWPFVRGILRSPVDSPHKDQWRGALVISLISAWTNGWANNGHAGDLRRHRAHDDVTVVELRGSNAAYQEDNWTWSWKPGQNPDNFKKQTNVSFFIKTLIFIINDSILSYIYVYIYWRLAPTIRSDDYA